MKFNESYFLILCSFLIFSSFNSCKDERTEVIQTQSKSSKSVAQTLSVQKIFDGNAAGPYHSFRIPSLIRSPNGTLIAFAEGRADSNDDFGNINLVYRRSLDNGDTWQPLQVLEGYGAGKFGNPVAVTDLESSTPKVWIFFLANGQGFDGPEDFTEWGQRRTFARYSTDNGLTWSTKQDLTASVLPPTYEFDMLGPGVGIQTTQAQAGRLIIPALRRNIYSDDNGATWQYQPIPGGTTESTIVEKSNGTLLRNDRPTNANCVGRRYVSSGTIESGFSNFTSAANLLDPCSEGSTLRYPGAKDRILFLNSQSTTTRHRMYIKISYDGGNTWPISKKIYDWLTDAECVAQGKGGYSSLAKTADNKIGALIEINENVQSSASSRSIEFHKFGLTWVLDGNPEP